jgi:hypothetical protein
MKMTSGLILSQEQWVGITVGCCSWDMFQILIVDKLGGGLSGTENPNLEEFYDNTDLHTSFGSYFHEAHGCNMSNAYGLECRRYNKARYCMSETDFCLVKLTIHKCCCLDNLRGIYMRGSSYT